MSEACGTARLGCVADGRSSSWGRRSTLIGSLGLLRLGASTSGPMRPRSERPGDRLHLAGFDDLFLAGADPTRVARIPDRSLRLCDDASHADVLVRAALFRDRSESADGVPRAGVSRS